MPPGLAQWAVLTGLLLATAVTLWGLIDCLNEPRPRTRYLWVAAILLTQVFGASAYLLFQRPRRRVRFRK